VIHAIQGNRLGDAGRAMHRSAQRPLITPCVDINQRPIFAALLATALAAAGGGTAMSYSQLSDEQVLEVLAKSHEAIVNILRYQSFLTSGAGLPKNDAALNQLIAANTKWLEKTRAEIKALEGELSRRENPPMTRRRV
jgi:hypothetical protein